MSKIRASIGYPPANGKQLSFRAPCSSDDTDVLIVNDVEYTLVDADGHNVARIPNLWNRGAMVSVILDTINNRAYVQNANTNGYIEGTFDDIQEQMTQISDILTDKENLTPTFVQNIDECVDPTKLYLLPDGYIYAYSAGSWQSTGIKIADKIPSNIVTSINGQAGDVSLPPPVVIWTIFVDNGWQKVIPPFRDVQAAYESGYVIKLKYENYLLDLWLVNEDEWVFTTAYSSNILTVTYRPSQSILSSRSVSLALQNQIPTKASQLENDLGFLTRAPVNSVNGQTGDVVVSVPVKVSDLQNDLGFLTRAPVNSVNGQTGDVDIPAPVKVTVTKISDGGYTADRHYTDLQVAYNNGHSIYCQYENWVLSLTSVTSTCMVFSAVLGGAVSTVTIEGNEVTVSRTPLISGDGGVSDVEVTLTDRKTAKNYVLYVSDGKLMMEESEE